MNKQNKNRISCSIVGARGYAGLELARLLLKHPRANLTSCFATSEFKLADHISSPGVADVEIFLDSALLQQLLQHLTDVVFLATPAEVSLKLAPQILAAGQKVIDLSGAFRLQKHDYATWYGFRHDQAVLLSRAQYGLSPWVGAATTQKLIANPGCFATAVTMALIPLLKNDVVIADQIVIDAKSGATGGGRRAAENLLFTEVDGECLPYKIGMHQHYPEIIEALEMFSGKKIDAHFSTSLLPIRRGIIAGIYAKMQPGKKAEDVEAAFTQAYGDYPLVKCGTMKKSPGLAQLKKVVGTANTHLSYEVDGDKLYLYSCIDNLLKGAASQAIENLNRLSDLPVETGVIGMEAIT